MNIRTRVIVFFLKKNWKAKDRKWGGVSQHEIVKKKKKSKKATRELLLLESGHFN